MNVLVSPDFKKNAGKAIFSIILFIFLYLSLVALAIGLTALCVIGGILIIAIKAMWITVALGIGLASLGFFILFFLLKFLFTKHKADRSQLYELKKEDEPRMYGFIEDVVKEVGTDLPKKIYLSSEVNASVFYNSTFWSMFLPVRKNLNIGVGLINSLTQQELKAILAHEFGHFSQKSMRVGSFVYNVNQVIYNLLYDNESFELMMQKWASVSGFFSIFLFIATKVIAGIQYILRKMYSFVNVQYLALSREMEFHADKVAVHVAGKKPMKDSLLRLDFAQHSLMSVFGFYETKIASNVKTKNLFQEHKFAMNFLAANNELPMENGFPGVSETEMKKFNKSKLNIKDQWASHPSTEDRIRAIDSMTVEVIGEGTAPALDLFDNFQVIEEDLSEKIFSSINFTKEAGYTTLEDFRRQYQEEYRLNTFEKIYNGYYDDRNIDSFDLGSIEVVTEVALFEDLYSKEKVDNVYELLGLREDKKSLDNINKGLTAIQSFDYNGKKYNVKEEGVIDLMQELEGEEKVLETRLKDNDINIYTYFLGLAKASGLERALESKYTKLFEIDNSFEKKVSLYTELINATQFMQVQTPFEEIAAGLKDLLPKEKKLKSAIKELVAMDVMAREINEVMRKNFESYLEKDLVYFKDDAYDNTTLQILIDSINDYYFLIFREYFLVKKDLLSFQAELQKKKAAELIAG
ncbi:MAG TPA: M48 family metallopeptidase [Cytophagaceae bacterium]|jgi:Zn-dependent protease with chaperone function